MKKISLIILSLTTLYISLSAKDTTKIDDPEITYTRVITERAAKIAETLGITDSIKYFRVRDTIAQQYRNLRNIYDLRDARIKALRERNDITKGKRDSMIDEIKNQVVVQLYDLHFSYLAKLSVELTPEQIDRVKDGMTYNVLPRTYNVYIEMLPNLTDEQKRFIMVCLIEAREKAIDAESSDKKHAVFGKYKGRINNYLSAAGYDLKKAEKEMLDKKNTEDNKK